MAPEIRMFLDSVKAMEEAEKEKGSTNRDIITYDSNDGAASASELDELMKKFNL